MPVIGSEQGGIRPVLIIQNDVGNCYSPTVIVAAITSRPKIISLLDLTRDIMESYLIYLQTEAKERKNYRSDLYGLRRVIEDVGNHYDRQDIKNLFISTDFPSTPRYLFKFYSDETIKKLNENIFQMDEQIARALILHQLLGTRISDTLTLKTDCLSIRENRYFIRIEQVKSITFEKAISDEIAQLIIKSIDYTEEHYGKITNQTKKI